MLQPISDIKFITVDERLYQNAGSIIKSVFIPENSVGVDISFKLSITPRELWPDVCKAFDKQYNTEFAAQFEPMASLTYFVMMNGDKPVGVSGIYSLKGEEKEAWVGWLGVAENEHGHGYGKQVLARVVELAREKGCATLRLWSEDYPEFAIAHEMYEKKGFLHERDVLGRPEATRESTYKLFSLNLEDKSIPAPRWPTASLRTFGLAGGISPTQIIDDGNSPQRPALQNGTSNLIQDKPTPK